MRVDSVHKNVWRLASKKVTKCVKGAFIEADLKILKSTICAKCERILYVGERKLVVNGVAPSRERGLKRYIGRQYDRVCASLLRGSVD